MAMLRGWHGRLQFGICNMIVAGISNTGLLVFSGVLNQMRWPCYRIMSLSCLLTSFATAVVIIVSGSPWPSASMVGWLFLRPVFACGSFICCILAVHAKTPYGDVASLGSINIVAAAFLGRLLLKEKIRLVHGLALLLSTTGAILISKPAFLLGGGTKTSGPWLGYTLALASGLLDALSFICSRKSADVPTAFIVLVTQSVSAVALFIMGSMPLVFEDYSLAVIAEFPWKAVLVTSVGCALAIICTVACIVGSVLCPAAVSTTVYTSSNMSSGYLAQLLLDSMSPSLLSLSGSALMLAAVIIMVLSREPAKPTDEVKADAVEANSASAAADDDDDHDDCHDDESIASFVASEFAVRSLEEISVPTVRQRRAVHDTPPSGKDNVVVPIVVGI